MKRTKVFKGPQVLIGLFLMALIVTAHVLSMSLTVLFNESLVKLVMNGILVLSLIPMLNGGMGMNFGLPVGITAGLVGMCLAINWELSGMAGFFGSIVLSVVVACGLGYAYGRLMIHLEGREEIGSTFIGLSFIPIMNFFWTIAPFSNRRMLYPIGGKGLRPRIGLNPYYTGVLDRLWVLQVGEVEVPLGLMLFYGIIALSIVIIMKSQFGRGLLAIGENKQFAKASGIDIEAFKLKSVILSTIYAAIGINVYAQSYGFLELYNGPVTMALPAVSALLIGGASNRKGFVVQAILGTYLLQSIYLLSVPIANQILLPEISEIVRSIIANGMILYALIVSGKRRIYAYE